jgi:hypothetical protein
MDETRSQAEDEVLTRLRDDFPGHKIRRSIRSDGRFGDWVATLHDLGAGVDKTVIRSTPSELRAELINERERAIARDNRLR